MDKMYLQWQNGPENPGESEVCKGETSLDQMPFSSQLGWETRTIPRTAAASSRAHFTWICSMQCSGDSADTHWISGLSLCRLKATAISPHFWISGVDSTHQRR